MVPGDRFPPLGPERFGMVPTYDRIGGWPNLQAVTECRQCGTLDGRGRQLRDGRFAVRIEELRALIFVTLRPIRGDY